MRTLNNVLNAEPLELTKYYRYITIMQPSIPGVFIHIKHRSNDSYYVLCYSYRIADDQFASFFIDNHYCPGRVELDNVCTYLGSKNANAS